MVSSDQSAEEIGGGSMFDTKAQKELREEYEVLLNGVWNGHTGMVKHCLQDTELLVKLDNGKLVAIKKPRIQKDFCFGYRLSSTDTKEYDDALAMAHLASKSEEYFIRKNLKDLDETIGLFENTDVELFLRNAYRSQPDDTLASVEAFRYRQPPRDMSGHIPVTQAQREILLQAYRESKNRFVKRLKTYLKRYGMSKVKTWSYWEDE